LSETIGDGRAHAVHKRGSLKIRVGKISAG
jgi:hypothetical protein